MHANGFTSTGFVEHQLDRDHSIWMGSLPEALRVDTNGFEELWSMHPTEYHDIRIYGRVCAAPRWQQAYGRDYTYSGSTANALPIPPCLGGLLAWARADVAAGLNGMLCNWYLGTLRHYIGPHHDSMKGIVEGSVIVTISLGEERVMRFRRPGTRGFRDFRMADGKVVLTPTVTNAKWKHEVPAPKRFKGRRISISIRAFES